jgi:hypothetical protein
MVRELRCDICQKQTPKIAAKLHFIPLIPGVNRGVHSNYTHHLDVGVCCQRKLLKTFRFRKRMSAEQYREVRKNGVMR